MVSYELAAELFSYDPEKGTFRRRVRRGHEPAGKEVCGCPLSNKYLVININGKLVRSHTLAWLLMTGKYPDRDIDHINHDRADNRWVNLRPATRSQNNINSLKRKDNTSGIRGVSWDKARGKWITYLKVGPKYLFLGRFDDIHDAAVAYRTAAVTHYGEYAGG